MALSNLRVACQKRRRRRLRRNDYKWQSRNNIVKSCHFIFFDLPSVQLSKRVEKFVTRFYNAYRPILLLCLSKQCLCVHHTVFNLVKIQLSFFLLFYATIIKIMVNKDFHKVNKDSFSYYACSISAEFRYDNFRFRDRNSPIRL